MKTIPKQKAIAQIESLIEEADSVRKNGRGSRQFSIWYSKAKSVLAEVFGEKSRHLREFSNISFTLPFWRAETPDNDFEDAFQRGVTGAVSYLKGLQEEVAEYWEEETGKDMATEPPKAANPTMQHKTTAKRVFIVHGHDHGLKETVARFLNRLGLEPIILHEQPNQGRTIIEKFEYNAEVQFAIVLLTDDDVGAPKKTPEALQSRARQNVVFEFGYFVGKLGREHVCGLVRPGIEIPSDILGVVYVPVDEAGQWRMLLVKELKMVWPEVDANLAI